MKVLVCGINFSPELTGIGKYSGEFAAWLVANGHEVKVVTAPPYYPEWRIRGGYSGTRYSREIMDGAEVTRCPCWVPAVPSGLRRLLHLMSFALSSLPIVLSHVKWKPDLVVSVAPALVSAPNALLLARISGAKTWLHIQDFEVDAAFELGLLRGAIVRKVVLGIERLVLNRFDVVSTISGRMVGLLEAKGIGQERSVLFPNWVNVALIRPLTRPSTYRKQLKLPTESIVLLYSGNMGNKQGLELLPQIAKRLEGNPSVHFVLCGNGSARAKLIQDCQGLANVTFLDLQPVNQLNELLGLADIHLLLQRSSAADLVMPSRLTGMLASGRAIIATANAGTELWAVLKECGLVVQPGSADEVVEAIRTLVQDPGLRARLGTSARAFAESRLDVNVVLRTIEGRMERLIDKGL